MTDAILLLHGQPGSGRDWARVTALLDPGTAAIAPDRPGWGENGDAAGIDANGRTALSVLDGRRIGRATGRERVPVA